MDHIPGNLITAGLPVVVPYGLVTVYLHKITAFCRKFLVKLRSRHHHGLVLGKTACGGLHNGEGLRKEFIEDDLDSLVLVLHKFVGLGCKRFLFLNGNVFLNTCLYFRNAVLEGLFNLEDLCAEGGAALPKAIGR